MPDTKQIRATSAMGKTYLAKSFQKFSSKVPCCTQTPLLALGHTAPSMGSSKEQIHRFARMCCSEAQPLHLCALSESNSTKPPILSSPRPELTQGKVLWSQATGRFTPADCTFCREQVCSPQQVLPGSANLCIPTHCSPCQGSCYNRKQNQGSIHLK